MPNEPNAAPSIQRLARVLMESSDDRTCTACLDRLEEYVDAQLAGLEYAGRFASVVQHLDSCVACAESYALLYETRRAAEQLPAPARVPAPDLSFLPQPAARRLDRAAVLAAALAAAVARTGAQLRLMLSQALLDLLPAPAAAPALRGAAGSVLLDLDAPVSDSTIARIHLTAYRHTDTVERCDLRVRLSLHGRDWPDLAQIPVVLQAGDQRQRALTDAWGEVVFTDLAAVDLPCACVEVEQV